MPGIAAPRRVDKESTGDPRQEHGSGRTENFLSREGACLPYFLRRPASALAVVGLLLAAGSAVRSQSTVLNTYNGMGWHLISSPYTLNQPATSIAPNVFAWSPTANAYSIPTGSFQPGQGYWLFVKGNSLDIPGPGTPADNTKPFTIPLGAGWNLVGNPFTTPAMLSQISVTDANGASTGFSAATAPAAMLVSPLYTYDTASGMYSLLNTDTQALNPWDGAWVFAKQPGLSLVFNAPAGTGGTTAGGTTAGGTTAGGTTAGGTTAGGTTAGGTTAGGTTAGGTTAGGTTAGGTTAGGTTAGGTTAGGTTAGGTTAGGTTAGGTTAGGTTAGGTTAGGTTAGGTTGGLFPPGAQWKFVGPNGYVSAQRTYNGDQAINGRVNNAVFDPRNPGTYYIAAAGGGVWRTTDSGQTWTPLTDGQDSLWTSCIVMDPQDSNTLYVGTGDFTGSEGRSIGLLKTTNATAPAPTWTAVGGMQLGSNLVSRVLVDPQNTNIITVATGRGAAGFGQVWRSPDGGASWTAVITTQGIWSDLAMSAPQADQSRIYYAAGFLPDGRRQIMRSMDQGQSWMRAWESTPFMAGGGPDTSSLVAIAASPTSPRVVYAVVARPSAATIMRSEDAGDTWTDITTGFPMLADNFKQAFYNVALAVSTMQAAGGSQDILYVGGLDLVRGQVVNSTTVTWSSPGMTLTDKALFHCDQQRAAVNPADPNQVLACCDGGVYRLVFNPADGSSQVSSLNGSLGVTQLYNVSFNPTDPASMIGGAQDNGTVVARGSLSLWNGVIGGDGGFCTLNPQTGAIQLGSAQNLSGLTVTQNAFMDSMDYMPSLGMDMVKFIAPIILDPTQPSIDYFGTNYLNSIDTTNGMVNQRIGGQQLSAMGALTAIAVSPTDGTRIYTGSEQGELWMTTNRGAAGSWTQINTNGTAPQDPNMTNGLPAASINAIAVSGADPNVIFVGIGGAGTGHLWKCANTTAGAARTWVSMSGSGQNALPDVAVYSISIDPRDASQNSIYVGTEVGIFATTDGGANWMDVGRTLGLPRIRVNTVRVVPGTGFLMAATFGRGIWRIPLTAAAQARAQVRPAVTRQAGLSAPVLLGAVGSNDTLDLTWQPSTGATGYVVERSTTPGGPYTQIATVTGTTYEDTGLQNGTFYYYVILATQGATTSSPSNEASGEPVFIPAPPEDVIAAPGDKVVMLSWQPVPGADFYSIKRTTDPAADDMDQIADNITDTSFADHDVVNGQTYYYHVTAMTRSGQTSDPGGDIVEVTPGGTADVFSGTVTFQNKNGAATPLPGTLVQLKFNGPVGAAPDTSQVSDQPNSDQSEEGVEETTTDAAGKYSFGGLTDGSYTAQVVLETAAAVAPITRTLDFHVNNGVVSDANFTVPAPGPLSNGFNLVSLPFDYTGSGTDIAAALGIAPTGTNTALPIYAWDPVAAQYLVYPNLPNGNLPQPSRGYWVFEATGHSLAVPGKPVANPQSITLSPGWNMIGDPFNITVPLEDLEIRFPFAVGDAPANEPVTLRDAAAAGLIQDAIWAYSPNINQYVAATALEPLQGYWLYLNPAKAQGQNATLIVDNGTS